MKNYPESLDISISNAAYELEIEKLVELMNLSTTLNVLSEDAEKRIERRALELEKTGKYKQPELSSEFKDFVQSVFHEEEDQRVYEFMEWNQGFVTNLAYHMVQIFKSFNCQARLTNENH